MSLTASSLRRGGAGRTLAAARRNRNCAPGDASLLAEVWEAVQRACADAGQTPHVRSLAATAARIYDDRAALAPDRRLARLKAAVAALKADAEGGA